MSEALTGPIGTTPPCPEAKFQANNTVKVRRLEHLKHLPEIGVIVCVVAPGFSPDHALDDFYKRPRKLLAEAGSQSVSYIVAFEDDLSPHLLPECELMPSGLPDGVVGVAGGGDV